MYLCDISDVGDLADDLQNLLRAGRVEVEAAHRDAAGPDTAKRERRDVDLDEKKQQQQQRRQRQHQMSNGNDGEKRPTKAAHQQPKRQQQ